MRYLRAIRGQFRRKHFLVFGKLGIKYVISAKDQKTENFPKEAALRFYEDSNYKYLLEEISDAIIYVNRRTFLDISSEELKNHDYFLLKNTVPNNVELFDNNKECKECSYKTLPSTDYFHFKKEPKIPDDNLFVYSKSMNNQIITDLKKFNILNDKWKITSRNIYIGNKKLQSEKHIALNIPTSEYNLNFTQSDFGKIKKKCGKCKTIFYNGLALDKFPSFKSKFKFDICRTQELFIPLLRPIIISYRFAQYLVETYNYEWSSIFFIPVRE